MDHTRRDGWTPARRTTFLAMLEGGASVADAARHVGMSRAGAYALRARAGTEFVAAWDAAADAPRDAVRSTLLDHLTYGTVTPKFYHGRIVGEQRHFDTTLMLAALRRWGGSSNRV